MSRSVHYEIQHIVFLYVLSPLLIKYNSPPLRKQSEDTLCIFTSYSLGQFLLHLMTLSFLVRTRCQSMQNFKPVLRSSYATVCYTHLLPHFAWEAVGVLELNFLVPEYLDFAFSFHLHTFTSR